MPNLPELQSFASHLLLAVQDVTQDPALGGGDGGQPPSDQPLLVQFFPFIAIGFIFYFLLIRPESKKRREQEQMQGNLKKGDKVMTNSGILRTIATVQEDIVHLQVAQNVRIRVVRGAIQGLADPDARKADEAAADGDDGQEKAEG